jgi:acyl-CoA dehydrogenase
MDFSLTDEQKMIIDTLKSFVEQELYPHETEVEKTNQIRPELYASIKQKAIELGLYAANMPEEHGGAGLDSLTLCLMERELGRANFGLQYIVGRPSNILLLARVIKLKTTCMPLFVATR